MKQWWTDAKAKGQRLVELYGNIAIVTLLALMVSSYTVCYLVIDSGADLSGRTFLGADLGGVAGTSGKAAAAFALYKVFMPVRIGLAALLTPVVARVWWRFRPPEAGATE